MTNEHFLYNSFREKENLPRNSKHFYGSKTYDDYMLHNPESLPRIGYLARKAMSHYAGVNYNPHQTDFWVEELFRLHIYQFIKSKIFYRQKEYDWEYIDNYLKKMTADLFKIDLKYDDKIVKKGHSLGFKPPKTNTLPI